MNPEEAKKLLGGYATGTLTDEERRVLFEAALDDQDLFDALASEQTLKEALEMPGARDRLLRAARAGRERAGAPPWFSPFRKPWRWAAAGASALIALLVVIMVRTEAPQSRQMAHLQSAPVVKTAPPAVRAEAPKPAAIPQPKAKRFTPQRAAAPAAPAAPPPVTDQKKEARAAAPARAESVTGALAGAALQPGERTATSRLAGTSGFAPMAAVAQPGLTVNVVRVPEPNALQAPGPYHAGDSIQLRVAPPLDGKLYVLRTDDSGADWTLAYSADARAGAAQTVPLRLNTAGQTWLVVVLSREPLVQLTTGMPDRNVIEQMRRDAGNLALAQPATANANGPANAQRLVREIKLTVEP